MHLVLPPRHVVERRDARIEVRAGLRDPVQGAEQDGGAQALELLALAHLDDGLFLLARRQRRRQRARHERVPQRREAEQQAHRHGLPVVELGVRQPQGMVDVRVVPVGDVAAEAGRQRDEGEEGLAGGGEAHGFLVL